VVLGRGLPVLGEGLRRQLHLDERELGLHPLGAASSLGVDEHPLPIPPEPSGGDGGLGHGDASAGLDGVHEDGRYRGSRRPGIAAAGEERGEE